MKDRGRAPNCTHRGVGALRRGVSATTFALVIACGSRTPAPAAPEAASSVLSQLNQGARSEATVETHFGVRVADPYRGLERESEMTNRWIEMQSARTRSELTIRPGLRQRLAQLLQIGSLHRARVGGTRTFFQLREGARQQPRLMVVDSGAIHPLMDPQRFGPRAALDWYYPSPDGKLVAFGISDNGDEKSTLRLLDVDAALAGETDITGLEIRRAKWCSLAWLPDSAGFYYTRYPNPGEPNFDGSDAYFPRVFFHRLGTSSENDPRIFGSERGTDFPSMDVSADGRWLTLNVFRGWSQRDVFLLDRHADTPIPTEVVNGSDSVTSGTVYNDRFIAITNIGAPKYRVVVAPVDQAGNQDQWHDLIAEREHKLEDFIVGRGEFFAHYVDNVHSRLIRFADDGQTQTEFELPKGAIESLDASPHAPHAAVAFSGLLQPPSLLTVQAAGPSLREVTRVESDFSFDDYRVDQEHVRSSDGTSIPIFVVRSRRSSPQPPVLVYGYGGFNVSLMPDFRRNALYWLERGGVYVIANLRGGGEFGEAWHRAGMLQHKENVFDDFEAVLSWVADSGLAPPERIAITGASNGGLLMGATATRVPSRFRAGASYVGLYDMLRYHRFPPAELWISEYGSAANEAQFHTLYGYSPYHRIENGTPYPAMLIETADHDSRVHWGHSTKFAAALQEATSSANPIYFLMERAQGHGAGMRQSDMVERFARMYTFFEAELDMR